MSGTVTVGGIPIIIGGNDPAITGTDADERILGTAVDNTIDGLAGNDLIEAGDGNDAVSGGEGDDGLLGDAGDDRLDGGAGSDVSSGGEGADTFILAGDAAATGDDIIVDFAADDVLAFNAAALLRENPELELSGAGLDAGEGFAIALAEDENGDDTEAGDEDEDGDDTEDGGEDDTAAEAGPVDLVITTPAGTTTVQGVDLVALGLDPENLSFEALETAGLLVFDGLIEGAGDLQGTENDDVIIGSEGDDTITGLAGDDIMAGGAGSDSFVFDPSNAEEGDDVISDFELPSTAIGQETPGDFIALSSEQVLAASPDLPAADGDGSSLTLADFDASPDWQLGGSENGFVLLTHPGGTIEFQGLDQIDGLTFEDLGPILLVDGEAFPEDGIPIEGGDNGTDGETDGETDGGTDGETDGETDGGTDGETDGGTDGGTEGETDGGTDGETDGGDVAADAEDLLPDDLPDLPDLPIDIA